jgi:hypothetical protein
VKTENFFDKTKVDGNELKPQERFFIGQCRLERVERCERTNENVECTNSHEQHRNDGMKDRTNERLTSDYEGWMIIYYLEKNYR